MTVDTTPMPDPGEVETARGRRAPFTQVGDWVTLSGVGDRAVALYCRLAMHVNAQRGDGAVWPAQEVLAELGGFGKPESVAPHIDELVVIGAITVEQTRYANGMRARNRYIVHETPPDWYVGPTSVGQYYALRRDRPKELEAWRKERRAWIAAEVKLLADARKAARAAPLSEGVRTPLSGGTARPAKTPASGLFPVPLSGGVRTPSQRGSAPRPQGVEQEEVQPDEDSSLSSPPSAADAPPPAADEREKKAAPKKPTTAQQVVRASGAVTAEEEQAFIAWAVAKFTIQSPGWWHKAAGDVPELAETWRASLAPGGRPAGPPLPPWCGECNGEPLAERWVMIPDPDGYSLAARCPRCNPHHPNLLGQAGAA